MCMNYILGPYRCIFSFFYHEHAILWFSVEHKPLGRDTSILLLIIMFAIAVDQAVEPFFKLNPWLICILCGGFICMLSRPAFTFIPKVNTHCKGCHKTFIYTYCRTTWQSSLTSLPLTQK
jgi:hypothetical protein